jgi:hypothetical protein
MEVKRDAISLHGVGAALRRDGTVDEKWDRGMRPLLKG